MLRFIARGISNISEAGEFGLFPLYLACETSQLEMARLLLSGGASYEGWWRSLLIACDGGNVELVRVLSVVGVCVDKPMDDEETPLFSQGSHRDGAPVAVCCSQGEPGHTRWVHASNTACEEGDT